MTQQAERQAGQAQSAAHTALPLSVVKINRDIDVQYQPVELHTASGRTFRIANDASGDEFAELISTAVNAHAELVAALLECQSQLIAMRADVNAMPGVRLRNERVNMSSVALKMADAILAKVQPEPEPIDPNIAADSAEYAQKCAASEVTP